MKLHFIFIMILIFPFVSCNKGNGKNECEAIPNAQTIVHNGENREYILYVPSTYDGSHSVPVVLNFHGFGGQANYYMNNADMRPQAEADTFILVYPQGSCLDGSPHWNASLPGGDNKSEADDFGFIETLINDLASNYNVDLDRVYACGYSNGGMMAYGLAQNKSHLIAGVGSVSGVMLDGGNTSSHPMPVISIHGTLDGVLPYNGNSDYSSIQSIINYWVGFNNTDTSPTLTNLVSGTYQVEHYLYPNGDSSVAIEHYKIVNGDHVWFDLNIGGKNTGDLLWDFFNLYDINGLR